MMFEFKDIVKTSQDLSQEYLRWPFTTQVTLTHQQCRLDVLLQPPDPHLFCFMTLVDLCSILHVASRAASSDVEMPGIR